MTDIDVTQALIERAIQKAPFPRRLPATIISFDSAAWAAVVTTDEPGVTEVTAANLTGLRLRRGMRVMIDFVPPAGAQVVGIIGEYVRPCWRVSRTTQAIPTGAVTNANFTTLTYDTEGHYGNTAPGVVLDVPFAGRWLLSGRNIITGTTGARAFLEIELNFSSGDYRALFTNEIGTSVTAAVDLLTSDTVQLQVYHEAGADRNMRFDFYAEWLGPIP